MLDREQIKAHFRFLESASNAELEASLKSLTTLLVMEHYGSEDYFDLRFLLKHLKAEIFARAAVQRLDDARRQLPRQA